MAVADGSSLPVAVYTESASPHEVTLVRKLSSSDLPTRSPNDGSAIRHMTLTCWMRSLTLDIEMIAPHKSNRQKAQTQDGRKLRRYKRRWKIERLFARLQNFRRILVRYEYHDANYLGFFHLGCILILLRAYF
jgi:transposase